MVLTRANWRPVMFFWRQSTLFGSLGRVNYKADRINRNRARGTLASRVSAFGYACAKLWSCCAVPVQCSLELEAVLKMAAIGQGVVKVEV